MPISGFAAVVGECEHPDGVRHLEISNVVGEAFNRRLAGWYVRGDTRNTSCGLWPAGDTVERCINRFEKLDTEPWSSALVPDGSVFKFGGGLRFGSEGTVH
jgi:hypothetical protein